MKAPQSQSQNPKQNQKPNQKRPQTPKAPYPPVFPMRINKYLAFKGYATRRGADELIEKRWVTINGKIAILGDKVVETDHIEVRNNKKAEEYLYYAFNKPRGILSEKISASREFFPVLPLDAQAEGLVLVTNDRRIIDRLTNASHTHMKEYIIHTVRPLRPNFQEKIEQEGWTANIKNDKLFSLRVVNNDNKIRQMCATYFAEIESLTRTRILNIELKNMKPNERREIVDEELAVFLKALGL